MDVTNESSLCITCNQRPILIKKRKLCSNCYQKERQNPHSDIRGINKDKKAFMTPVSERTEVKYRTLKEMEFIKNFFKHGDWIYEPCLFRLTDGSSYQPDFYDSKRNVFIEVAGTRQAYHYNRTKYLQFKKDYPQLQFEIRTTAGQAIDPTQESRIEWS